MSVLQQTVVVDRATAAALLRPRQDVVEEEPDAEDPGDGVSCSHFGLGRGPMEHYRREVVVTDEGGMTVTVTETTRYRLALGVWSPWVQWPLRREMRRLEGRDRHRSPAWAPPEMLDSRSATILGLLLTLALVTGYLGTVMTQTVAFAAAEFGQGTDAQGSVLAAVRVGTLGSLVLVALADRHGRRRLLLGSLLGACAFTAAGAFVPSLAMLGVTQTAARAFTSAATLLIVVVSTEEMPAGSRAYAVSVMTMTGALGAGMAVWGLVLVDLTVWAWRVLYLVALFGIPVILGARRLPESQRFVRPHRDATVLRGHAVRFWAIGAALFCASAFGSPSSQLQNDFLRDERGFSSGRIALFIVLTSTPAGVALVAGGRLADTRGRRQIVALGIAGGAVLAAWGFTQSGWPLWMATLAATMLGALASPALGAYGPELFPTAARGKANGVLQVVSVAGAALGLIVAGRVAERTGQLADGLFVLLPLALLVAVLALAVFPETARRELEDINPEDADSARLAGTAGTAVIDADERAAGGAGSPPP